MKFLNIFLVLSTFDVLNGSAPGAAAFTLLTNFMSAAGTSIGMKKTLEKVTCALPGNYSSFLTRITPAFVAGTAAVTLAALLPFQKNIYDFWYMIISRKRLSASAAERAFKEVIAYAQSVLIINKIAEEFESIMFMLHHYSENHNDEELRFAVIQKLIPTLLQLPYQVVVHIDDLIMQLTERMHEGINVDDVIQTLHDTMAGLIHYWRELAHDQQLSAQRELKNCIRLLSIERFIIYSLRIPLLLEYGT